MQLVVNMIALVWCAVLYVACGLLHLMVRGFIAVVRTLAACLSSFSAVR